jgi:hypothetical protein
LKLLLRGLYFADQDVELTNLMENLKGLLSNNLVVMTQESKPKSLHPAEKISAIFRPPISQARGAETCA